MNLDCDIIRDLLPNYIDGLTSEKSNEVIKEHIFGCSECQKILSDMMQNVEPSITQNKKIEYLKKYKKRLRRNVTTNAIVLITLAVIICSELLIHLIPLHGAIKSDLNDYNTYPVMTVSLSDIKDRADIDDHSATYRIEWDKGSLFLNAVVQVTFYNGETSVSELSSEQIDVRCNGLFFKQTGDSVNIVDDIIYIQVSGYRKTLFFTGGAEPFGFALKIMND